MSKHLYLLLGIACIGFTNPRAQNWINGGNTLSANGTLGTNSSHSLIFKTSGLERGRITNGGNWGIGTSSPLSKLAVNSATGASPLRASIAGVHKFVVNANGGVSIGSGTAGPVNGLYVAGSVGIGTASPAYKLQVIGNAGISKGLTVGNGGTFSYNASGSYGVFGSSSYIGVSGTGSTYGVSGDGGNYGVYGVATNTSGVVTYGVYGKGWTGVYGTGSAFGVYGYTEGSFAVYGLGGTYGVYGGGAYGVAGNGTTWAGHFTGKVHATGGYTSGSDRKLKQNITDLSSVRDIISKLQPKAYEYRQDGDYQLMNLPKGKHYGLIAQDLEEVLPDMVYEAQFNKTLSRSIHPSEIEENKDAVIDYKAVNYMELIPILVKAMQEQQQVIDQLKLHVDEQQQQIEVLKNELVDLKHVVNKTSNGMGVNTLFSKAELGEVSPNPVKSTASIQYSIPEGSKGAHLLITDALGRSIRQLSLSTSGMIHINVSTLANGVYNYSLIVNNKTVTTRKMTVLK